MNRQQLPFYAHSTKQDDKNDWQLLKEHLVNVGELAGNFSSAFNCAEYGKVAGLLHDLGKYTVEFQQRLEGKHPRVDHATWGAKVALYKYGACGYFVAYNIAGHHAGLANGDFCDDQKLTPLKKRCENADLPVLNSVWQTEIEPLLPQKLTIPPLKTTTGFVCFQQTFLSRMIFSCLIDADRLDTEKFYQIAEKKPLLARGDYPSLTELKEQFDQSLNAFQQSDNDINQKRSAILSTVRHNAKKPVGLFSLTVPTGGGKTLTSMAFALEHAETYQKRRIIYVIPFTSIIEQNAEVFRKQFGENHQHAIIEHHSAFNDVDIKNPDSRTKLNMAMENWDAPIIVTTAVQFMESLFSNRPSNCRKLHRIANSIIILDEAQTLPLDLLRPCMAAIDELAKMKEVMDVAEFKDDLLGLSAIKEYFSRVYWQKEMGQNSELDKYSILETLKNSNIKNLPFDWMAQKFKMISTTMKTVIVPYDDAAKDYIEQLKNLSEWESVGQLARKLQVYTISVPQHLAGQLINSKLGALKYVQAQRFGDQFLVLESDNMYEENIGFNPQANPLLINGEDSVW